MVQRPLSVKQATRDGLFLNGLQFAQTRSCLAFEILLLVEAARWESLLVCGMFWCRRLTFELGLAKKLT